MRKATEWKRVFCLEGAWENNLKNTSSVEPVLSLLYKQYPLMKYIHKTCATVTEFEFYLKKWVQKGYKDYPILYLAFHGTSKHIELSDGEIELTELAKLLEGQCGNRMIVFASCSTLNIDKRIIKTFIRKTGCLAVCGYRTDVAWIEATAFELLLLDNLQENEFSGRGIKAIEKRLNKLSDSFPALEFIIVTNRG